MYDEYVQRMKLSNGPEALQQMTEHCEVCNIAREEISSEGILVCPRCGSEEYALVVSDFPTFP
jgi:Zn finger protein HypA/HybF involved in hydrogenase expression